ncbi:hypothetical protein GCK72_021142 [Caenorhabditis remanei]|uniref:Sdz-33 F-box domain-containing protein n=1 Tax=Caenorhabditis remanei TaxID=31234 RepID=A0A6A5GJS2_CAERE|nr:hypothetical protein GCK72_021142 [Caenorhabditis remanei]KAF1754579.1 hypothetical protein GCK72_021142 [Caenorhabditis remanei]
MILLVARDYLCIVDWRDEKLVTLCFDTKGVSAHIKTRYRWFTHENTGLTATQWVERILDVTNCESIDHLDLCGDPQLETFGQETKLNLNTDFGCSYDFAKKPLEILSAVTTEVKLYIIPFETREEFQTFLKSNLNYLNIQSSTFTKFKFTLDDVLITNALKLNLKHAKLTLKELNLFFKNWMRKKCDSRLEHLIVSAYETVNARNLLGGLKAVPFPRDRERRFIYSKQLDFSSRSFSGGYDISRADGKKATITYAGYSGPTVINFYVWP